MCVRWFAFCLIQFPPNQIRKSALQSHPFKSACLSCRLHTLVTHFSVICFHQFSFVVLEEKFCSLFHTSFWPKRFWRNHMRIRKRFSFSCRFFRKSFTAKKFPFFQNKIRDWIWVAHQSQILDQNETKTCGAKFLMNWSSIRFLSLPFSVWVSRVMFKKCLNFIQSPYLAYELFRFVSSSTHDGSKTRPEMDVKCLFYINTLLQRKNFSTN